MNLAYSLYAMPLLVAAVLSAVVALYVWPRRNVEGATQLTLIAAVIATWSLGYAFEIMAADLAGKIFWGKSQYIGITFAPYFWLVFAVAYTRQGQARPWFRLRWLAILPLTTTLLAFTTDSHGLIWTEMSVTQQMGFAILDVSYGAWFWFHFVASYLFLLAGTIILLRGMWRMQGLYRAQVVALLVATLTPWVSNILFFANLSPIPGLDLTPFAFTITVVALAWGILGYRLVDIAPIARDLVLEGMREGVMVINGRGRIADLNPAAARIIGLSVEQAIGQWAAEVLLPWPHLLDYLHGADEAQDEFMVGRGETERRYRVRISTLYDAQQRPLGRLFTLREALGTAEPPPLPRMVRTAQLLTKQGKAGEATAEPTPTSFWERSLPRILLNLFIPPPLSAEASQKQDLNILSQLLERAFTAMLRLALLIATPSLVLSVPRLLQETDGWLLAIIFTGGVLAMAAIGFLRHIPFSIRSYLFLSIFYLIALGELLNYGYSPEAFVFFLTLSVLAVLLRGLWGGLFITLASTISLYMVGWQIWAGSFIPYLVSPANAPFVGTIYFPTVMVFLASAVALIIVVIILTQSVNRAWWQETQAKNLLQQERDLLEERVAERTQQLLNSEANLRAFINSTPAIILQVDAAEKVVFGRIPGMAEEEVQASVIGRQLFEFIHLTDHELVRQNLAQAFATYQTVQVEFNAYNPTDEAYHPYLTSIAPFLDGEQALSVLLICTDITEQKEAEQALQQTVQELERLTAEQKIVLDNAPAAIFMQKERNIIWGNHATELVLGYTAEEMRHLPNVTYHVSPEAYAEFGAVAVAQQAQGGISTSEIQIRHKDGSLRWVYVTGQAINPQRVREDGILWIMQDISERKQVEATLQAYAEQLAIARDQALEASQYKSLLLGKVSHELRTPLGGILGYAELLRDEIAGPLAPDQREFVAYMIEATKHLNSLITDLLDQAQIEQGTVKISPRPVHLLDTVFFLRDLLQPLAAKKGLGFALETAPDLPENIIADDKRLRQIVINLASNAIKFTETGMVKVALQRLGSEQWQIEISDTGPGIEPEAQKRIFDSFWQVDGSPSSLHKGYGLGLSIVQQLVVLMGGTIEVSSELGRGSTFIVVLPLVIN